MKNEVTSEYWPLLVVRYNHVTIQAENDAWLPDVRTAASRGASSAAIDREDESEVTVADGAEFDMDHDEGGNIGSNPLPCANKARAERDERSRYRLGKAKTLC